MSELHNISGTRGSQSSLKKTVGQYNLYMNFFCLIPFPRIKLRDEDREILEFIKVQAKNLEKCMNITERKKGGHSGSSAYFKMLKDA